MRLQDKAVLITGATGMGAAAARLASAEGARVLVASLREEDCRALSAETGCAWHAGDLRDPATAAAAVALALERFGRLDGVFNVAGASGRAHGDGPVHECTGEGWEFTVAANLTPVFMVCRAALPHMVERRAGSILNMASVSAFSPEPAHFATHAYAAAKGAIIALTRAMAAYYAPHGIRVNALAPGLVRTPMSRRAQNDPELLRFMERKQPLSGGIMEPDEVARAAVFLLSDDARTITGQVLAVDAGWSVSLP